MKMGLLFPVEPVEQISGQQDPQRAEPGKQDQKRDADLPEQLQWLIGIIPHFPFHPLIDDHARNEFPRPYKQGASKHLEPEGILPF